MNQQAGTLKIGRLHDAASKPQAQGSCRPKNGFGQLGQQLVNTWPQSAGYLVGRDIRAVEWDAVSSPSLPDGRAVSFKLRALTPEGLRIALAKQYRLEGAKDVKQVRSSTGVAATGQHLSEPLAIGSEHGVCWVWMQKYKPAQQVVTCRSAIGSDSVAFSSMR